MATTDELVYLIKSGPNGSKEAAKRTEDHPLSSRVELFWSVATSLEKGHLDKFYQYPHDCVEESNKRGPLCVWCLEGFIKESNLMCRACKGTGYAEKNI